MRVENFFLLLLAVFQEVYLASSVKVCSTWLDYWKILGKNTCKENLDDQDEFVNIVSRWGKLVETYEILTYDGYILTLFRIGPQSKEASPVLLLHGTFMNSIAFVNRGKKSLAHHYVEAGYDVWLINWRGTKYSKNHISLTTKDLAYWKFSFDEWGTYDLSSAINHIRTINPKKILLVGFEIGTTAAFVYASQNPDIAKQSISGMVSLSPFATLNHSGFMFKWSYYLVPYFMKPLLDTFYHGELPSILRSIRASVICRKGGIWVARICDASFQSSVGLDLGQQDPETLPIIVAQNKDSEPIMNQEHMYQLLRENKLVKFCYGSKKNMQLYGQSSPPAYNLSAIKVPQFFFIGQNDKAGTVQDATSIYQLFDKAYQAEFYTVPYSKFGLADFVQAKNINELLYIHMIESVTKSVPPL